jgi:ornithine carbamoyltransferase
MFNPNQIAILFIPTEQGELVDVEKEYLINSPAGIMTWRRANQLHPQGAELVATIELDDALRGHDVALSERLISFSEGQLSLGTTRKIITKFYEDITAMVAQHDDSWLFMHSLTHMRNMEALDRAVQYAEQDGSLMR